MKHIKLEQNFLSFDDHQLQVIRKPAFDGSYEALADQICVSWEGYSFADPCLAKLGDFALITIREGFMSPLQLLQGDTIYLDYVVAGQARLTVYNSEWRIKVRELSLSPNNTICLHPGTILQWKAQSDLLFMEFCSPPFDVTKIVDLTKFLE